MMFSLVLNSFVFIILTCFMIGPCYSKCETVSSKYGTLFLGKTERPKSSCISNLIFQSKETGKSFCLRKERKNTEKLTCTGCFCGQENKPLQFTKVVGGNTVAKNQYPWYAMLLRRDGNDSYKGKACGGTLISENVVLSAAHCVDFAQFVGLGLHDISGNSQWSEKDWKKYLIIEVKERITHEEWSIRTLNYDFSLLILKDPVRISRAVSPVCLPNINEVDVLERKENIHIGFGTTKVWFVEYKNLLGGNLETVSLIPPEISFNKSTLLSALTNEEFHKNIVRGYFKTLIELFPGIEICIREYEFVCNITDQTLDDITRNIEQKIYKSGSRNQKKDVVEFLDETRTNILPKYQEQIELINYVFPHLSTIIDNFGFWYIPGFDDEAENEIEKYMRKYQKQWFFIARTLHIAISHFKFSDILKKATGKFVPWSEANRWSDLNPILLSEEHPSRILVERFEMKDGYTCPGDSGGPIMVESNGHFSVVAVLSTIPQYQYVWSWPPPCFCSCQMLPEQHARVSHVLPWIYQKMDQRELNVSCKN